MHNGQNKNHAQLAEARSKIWSSDIVRAKIMASRDRPLQDRLEKYQIKNETGCWGWSGGLNTGGYPRLRINKCLIVATQVALEADGRPKPSPKHVACHSCDNPICTRPDHPWWGTKRQNTLDALAKGRLKIPGVDTVR